MLRELEDFDSDSQMIWECKEHGEYDQYDLDKAGIEYGCPVCFQIDEESDRMEAEGC